MHQFILDAPTQLRQASQASRLIEIPSGIQSAWLLGMGGSALSAGLVSLLRARQKRGFPFEVVRDYSLPCTLPANALVLALSYSGNTEETLSALHQAVTLSQCVVAVSHGGELATQAGLLNLPHVQVPDKPLGFQPRFALPFMFGVVKSLLERAGLLACEQSLEELADWLEMQELEPLGKELAEWIGDSVPAVYSSTDYEMGVARTWRIKFNENAKSACLWGALPEMNHNEMMAFGPGDAGRYALLLLRDPDDDIRVNRRFPLMASVLAEAGHRVRVVDMQGRSCLEKAMGSLLLADWVTYHVAQLRGLDPVAIPAIQEFKKRL